MVGVQDWKVVDSKQKRSSSFTEKFLRSRPLITYLRPSGLAGSKKRFWLSDTDKLARLLLLPAFYLLSLTQRGFLSLFLVFSWSPRLYIFSFLRMDKRKDYRCMMAENPQFFAAQIRWAKYFKGQFYLRADLGTSAVFRVIEQCCYKSVLDRLF